MAVISAGKHDSVLYQGGMHCGYLLLGVLIKYCTNSSHVGSSLTLDLSIIDTGDPKLFLQGKEYHLNNFRLISLAGEEVCSKSHLCMFSIFLDNLLAIVLVIPILLQVTGALGTPLQLVSEC